jgi:GntR family transcriptional regulator
MIRRDPGMPGAVVAAAGGMPLHRQLFLVLHDEIERGALAAGQPLPTELELCEQFGVSRITVRRALTDLADQGYITRRQGVGSFVRDRPSRTEKAHTRSYMDELRQVHFETDAEVLACDLADAPPAVIDLVGLSDRVLHTLRR